MLSRGKVVISAAFVGLFAMFMGFYYYASLDNPALEEVQFDLSSVEIVEVNKVDQRANLELIFLVSNPSEKTITISSIHYELLVNNKIVGNGEYSAEDISLPGRALIPSGGQVPYSSTFNLVYTNHIAEEYSAVTNNEDVMYTVKGTATIKSAWTEIDKQFESVLS
jgi:LEA14-like dessication related protein